MSRFVFALKTLLMPFFVGGIIFLSAGRWDLPFVWAVLAVLTVLYMAISFGGNASMLQERQAPGPGNQDRLTQPVGALALVSHWILAGLDVGRFEWSVIPWQIQLAGLVGYALTMVVLFWAVSSNPFYSSVVRVQTDRGQHPVQAGPYRFVRHPGYTATALGILSGGVALGSWIALFPLLVFVVLGVRRTLIEDRMLQRDLPGYAEYSQSVRYRLLPGLF